MQSITNLIESKGTPLARQRFTWRELSQEPISKLDDDAFTRVRIIAAGAAEANALRMKETAALMNADVRIPMSELCRVEQCQAATIGSLLSPDHSMLELSIATEQACIEITAEVAQAEPDKYQAQAYRFGLLDDFDHLYRYSALLDRLEGKDANNILQGYTDIVPGRPTRLQHHAPEDDVRKHYNAKQAALVTKIHAAMLKGVACKAHDYYTVAGPLFADPIARELYTEITAAKEQHVIQYTSLCDPNESLLEKCLIHELTEVYTYASCAERETNPRVKAIWERFLDYELGHLDSVRNLFKQYERRDPEEILNGDLPSLLEFQSRRNFIRGILNKEVDLRTNHAEFVPQAQENPNSISFREHVNSQGIPADIAAAGYRYAPGTELTLQSFNGAKR